MGENLILRFYEFFNGQPVAIEQLIDYRKKVETYIDSIGSGPYVPKLSAIKLTITKAIKALQAQGATDVDRLELVNDPKPKPELGKIAKEEPLRTKQLRAMFARLANGGENLPKKEKKEKSKTKNESTTEQPKPQKTAKQLKRESFVPKSRGLKEEKKRFNDFVNDIDKQTARRAFYNTSFDPDGRGDRWRQSHAQTLENFRNQIKPIADKYGKSEEFEKDFDRYRKKMKELAIDYLRSHSNVASAAIVGPARFPTARNNKRSDWADKKLGEYFKYSERIANVLKYKYLPDEAKPVKTGQANALTILEKRLADAVKRHEQMVAANKAFRSKKDVEKKLLDIGFTEKEINDLKVLAAKYNNTGNGYPPFYLQNSNAEIKRLQQRVEQVKKLNEKREGENKVTEYANGKVIENYTENRLQIIFPGKPDEATRTILKRNAFKWAPSQGAWQRQLTGNAKWVLDKVLKEIGFTQELKGLGKLNTAKTKAKKEAQRKAVMAKLDQQKKIWPKKNGVRINPDIDTFFPTEDQAKKYAEKSKKKIREAKDGMWEVLKNKTDNEIPPTKNQTVSASHLAGIAYKTFELTDQYKNDFHKLNSDTQVMIWGTPGSGKTVYLLKFAQYLAEKQNLKVLYVANEEFGRSTFAQKLKEFNIGHNNLSFAKQLTSDLINRYDVIFADSVNSMGMKLADYRALVQNHPGKMFVIIVQSTKDGDFRGGKDWEHEVDIAGEIKNRQLILRKNRLDGDNANKAAQLQKQDAIAEAKKKLEIKEAVKASVKPKLAPPTTTNQQLPTAQAA